VHARERAEVRRPLRGREGVRGRHHKLDRKDHKRGSTRPRGDRARQRSDCEDGRWGARGLPSCRHDARSRTNIAPAATSAAGTKAQAQTTTHTAAKTAVSAQAKGSTLRHT
jgi:hypothetical protein